uniref:Rab-GAP TBC domain-containing protein n=1 Tax=Clytia hemisphaerica TaxID=252671 RepID=A0A7M6DP46_9CNID
MVYKRKLHDQWTRRSRRKSSLKDLNFNDEGEKWLEKESLHSAVEVQKLKNSSGSLSSIWKNNTNKPKLRQDSTISVEPEIINGPEEEDDEPLLSGSGEFERSYSEGELDNWKEILDKWTDFNTKPSKLTQCIRRGNLPNAVRGDVWQRLSGNEKDDEINRSYEVLFNKDSQQEQVILWDVTRTFPAHERFREANGKGQNALYHISKAYSNYDEEVAYCQGLSFIIATFLLHVEEKEAYSLLVKMMYDYGLRDLFNNGFASLHQYFFVLDRILEDTLNDLYQHFQNNNIESHMYASQWFLTLFTAKFPLSLVFNIIDIIFCEDLDSIFQIAAALLKTARKDLLQLDFEGILKYFRINMPKYYMLEPHRKDLVKTIYDIKISKKKVTKYKQEYVQMKEEQELKEDPVERLKRENGELQMEKLRLERENDSLAYEVVTTQVSMQEIITDREEKLNEMIKETEQLRNHLTDAEEEAERLKVEEARVKDMWRDSMRQADENKAKLNRIIDDYKQILARLEERNEKLKRDFTAETELLKKQLSTCENCTNALMKNIYPDEDDEGGPREPTITKLLSKEDHEEQMRSLEEELIKTKVALAEEKNRADEIEMKLHNLMSANEKPWYKKVTVIKK